MQTTYRFTPKPDGSFENDAEHSWAVALECMLMTELIEEETGKKVDLKKVLMMALVHDLAEIVTGDTKTWDDKARTNKEEKERKAIQELTGLLPDKLKDTLQNLWEECEKKETIEAKIVKSIDRMDPVIHRVVTGVGYKNAIKELSTVKDLDEKELPRHKFSKTLTTMYLKIRKEAVEKRLIKS